MSCMDQERTIKIRTNTDKGLKKLNLLMKLLMLSVPIIDIPIAAEKR